MELTAQQAQAWPRIAVRGLPITACRLDDVRQIIDDAIAGRTPPQTLATVNLDFLRLAGEDADFEATLLGCSHRFADGWPVLKLARLAGHVLPERVTGSDLTPRICAWAGCAGWRLALVGADEAVQRELATRIPQRYGAQLVGHWLPRYQGRAVRDLELAAAIRASRADIILIALGSPKGETWMRENAAASGAAVAISVGASLGFLAGTVRRAPRLVQRLHGEFLWRLACEPRRLGSRYWRDFWFYRRALREAKRTIVAARQGDRT